MKNYRASQKGPQGKNPKRVVGKRGQQSFARFPSLNNHNEIFNPTKSNFSIDTLLLGINQFTIHPRNELIIELPKITTAGEILNDHPLFTMTNGRSFSGQKATFNNGEFVVRILSPDHLTLLFSPTRLVNGLNFFPISLGQFTRAIREKVTRKLREIGVHVDISSAKIYRIDLSKDVFLDKDVSSYHPIFELLPELNQRMRRKEFYKTTFYAGNTQWELAIYDKVRELKHQLAKGRIQATRRVTELLSSNILRVELRLKKRQKVRNKLKFKAEGGARTCDKFTHLQFIFPRLERFFNEELLSLLFKHEPSFTPSNRLDRLRKALESSDKQRCFPSAKVGHMGTEG